MSQDDTVASEHPGRARFEDARRLTRDFAGGTTDVHRNAETYTPREGIRLNDKLREDIQTWEQRSTWTEVYSAVKAAKDASVGLVLAQPPRLGAETPEAIQAFSEDVDGKGNHLMIYSREWLEETLIEGVSLTLVDLPEWPGGMERTEDNRIKQNIRPMWSRYSSDDIINWDGVRRGSKWATTLLVLRECTTERIGNYKTGEVIRHREIRLDVTTGVVSWSLYKLVTKGESGGSATREFEREAGGIMEAKAGVPLGYIPFVPLYGQKPEQPFVCAPLLAPIAELNLGYYRIASDRRWSMHLHFSPTLVIIGREPGPDGLFPSIRLGVGATIDVPLGGDAQFANPGSEAFEPSEKELTRIAQEMGSLSLAFLARDTQASTETATARRLEAQSGKASLSLLAQNLQDALEQLYQMTSDFLQLPQRDMVEVEVKMTYDLAKLDSATIVALNAIVAANNLSLETFMEILKTGGILPDNVEPAEEIARIEMQRSEAEDSARDLIEEQLRLKPDGSGE